MSNLVSEMVYSRRIGSPVRKAVLVYFAARASDDGRGVWASKPTIAEAIECGRSTVIRTINDFVAEGILREVGRRPCRGGSTTEYAMNLGAIAALPSVDDDAPAPETRPAAGPVSERNPSRSGTPPVPQRDPHPSRSGTQTIIGTIMEQEEPPFVPPPKQRRRPEVPIPPDWIPNERNRADADARQFSAMEIENEADLFRNYHTSRGTLFRDWDAAWRTWLGNARKFAGRGMAGATYPGRGGRGGGLASIAAQRRAGGQV